MLQNGSAVNNGVNVAALLDARQALTNAPEAARFKWRATCNWVNGTHSRSTVSSFYGLGGEQMRKVEFKYDCDHPEVFASEDNGATPVEMVLVGLASCLTAGVAAVAQHRKIQLRKVTAHLEGSMNIQGILGIDADVRNGYDGIKVIFDDEAVRAIPRAFRDGRAVGFLSDQGALGLASIGSHPGGQMEGLAIVRVQLQGLPEGGLGYEGGSPRLPRVPETRGCELKPRFAPLRIRVR